MGIVVDYTSPSNGTATVGLDIENLDPVSTPIANQSLAKFVIYEDDDAKNYNISLTDLASEIISAANKSTSVVIGNGNATSYVLQNSGAVSPNKNHGLGTNSDGFMVQCVEVSSGETVYPEVTRGSNGNVTVSFTSAPNNNNIRVLINNVN